MIGFLVGSVGGDVAQAAVARYALERFEQEHERKATKQDVMVLLGLMKSIFTPK